MNCAESLLCAANDEYSLGIDPVGLRIMAGFGGGMGLDMNCCGALSGAVAAISTMFTRTKAHEDPVVKDLCKAFLERFMERHGEIYCGPLKELHRDGDEKIRCLPVVEMAAAVLKEIIKEEEARLPNS